MIASCRSFEAAPGWFLRAVAEDQRHPIARRQPDELFVRRNANRRGSEHDLSELVQPLLLFLDEELRVTDDVDEQDMPDLKWRLSFDSGARFFYRPRSYTVMFF